MSVKIGGLTSKNAEDRLEKYGYNEIKDVVRASPFRILLRQIKSNFIIYLLAFAMLISFFVGKTVTGYAVLAVITLVISAGFIQEYRAERAVSALKQMIMPISIVYRDGKEKEIPSKEIVPDDKLVLRTGERIPADCIVVEEKQLYVNESVLTGESKEIRKLATENIKKYKDENVLFTGSFIVSGKCLAKVIHTGMNTKFGKIAGMISTAEKELPLQKKVNNISKYMAIVAITVSVLTGLIMFFTSEVINYDVIISILILVIALSVSAFPEGFPVVLITALSVGSYRMARKNAIVNRMSIIETLGETTVICSDKTGTITKGEMTVKKIFTDDKFLEVSGAGYEGNGEFFSRKKKLDIDKEKNLQLLLKASVLCNDSRIDRTGEDNNYRIFGTPTEAALLIVAAKAKLFRDDMNLEIKEEIPFSSERKMMSILCRERNDIVVYSKGAPEILLKKCTHIEKTGGVCIFSDKEKQEILNINKKMTSQSFRTLALAYKKTKLFNIESIEKDLVFIGLVGMEDPPRKEIKESIRICKRAGINVKMITGDNRETALSVVKQIGLKSTKLLEGEDLDKMTDEELAKIVKDVAIFSRVRPEHKIRIVRALKENGEIVIMTGDGVNDSPALKEAHIGVAMGKSGTDVSRSVADLILKDDNFATIVDAIKEGRTIFNNIRKFMTFQLSCNYAELFIIFMGVLLSPFLGWTVPLLLALQILFMNLVTDNLPAITLSFNPSSKDIMERKPRKKSQILNKNLFLLLAFAGTMMGLLTLGVFYFTFNILHQPMEYARTTALLALIMLEISAAFIFKSFRYESMSKHTFSNKYLIYASLISMLATVLIIYTPLNGVFETVPLPIINWIIATSFPFLLIIIFDLLKRRNNKERFWLEE